MQKWFGKLKNRDWVKRSVRTFLQAFIGVFFAGIASGELELFEWKTWILTLISSSVAAGIAAIMNQNQNEEVNRV